MEDVTPFVANFTHIVSALTIFGMFVVVLWGVLLICSYHTKKHFAMFTKIAKYTLPLGFLISFSGLFLSLLYSEVFKFDPCDLCWFQRIFLYPQAFMFAYAWWKKDTSILPYSFILSMVGFLIATYHHALQMGYNIYRPCSTSPFAVDCSKPSFIEFGFVTFPFMAVVLFAFLIALVITFYRTQKHSRKSK